MRRSFVIGLVLGLTLALGLVGGSIARASFGWMRLSAPCENINAIGIGQGKIAVHCVGDGSTIRYTDFP